MISPLYEWLGAAILCAALLGGSFAKGYQVGTRREHQKTLQADNARLIAEQAAVQKRIAENAALVTKHNAEKIELRRKYQNELTKARVVAADSVRLRVSTSICAGFAASAQSNAASGSTATTAGTVLLPEAVSRNLQDLARQADEMLAGCRAAQDFIRQQEAAP